MAIGTAVRTTPKATATEVSPSNVCGENSTLTGWFTCVNPRTAIAPTATSSMASSTPCMIALVLICRMARPPTTSIITAPTSWGFCDGQITERYWPAPSAMELGIRMTETSISASEMNPIGRPRMRATIAHSPPVTGKAVPASA